MRHYATLYAIKALYQPSAPEWIAASLEIRRKRDKAKHRSKNKRWSNTHYKRKYGMDYAQLIVFFGVSQTTITAWDRKKILGHRIKLAKLRRGR